MIRTAGSMLAATMLLAGCNVASDGEGNEVSVKIDAGQEESAAKAEDGRVTIKAPGFNMDLKLPEEVAKSVELKGDADILYPGARIEGINVNAREGRSSTGEVELRFSTDAAPNAVGAWYRDPARRQHFSISPTAADGTDFAFTGTAKSGNDPFTVRFGPGKGGGTRGSITVRDRN